VNPWRGDAVIIKTDVPDIPLASLVITKQRVHVPDLRHEATRLVLRLLSLWSIRRSDPSHRANAKPRDMYEPDSHIDSLKTRARNFR
jgi:hypothetical protein